MIIEFSWGFFVTVGSLIQLSTLARRNEQIAGAKTYLFLQLTHGVVLFSTMFILFRIWQASMIEPWILFGVVLLVGAADTFLFRYRRRRFGF